VCLALSCIFLLKKDWNSEQKKTGIQGYESTLAAFEG
jgi:hypothetical protein